MFPELAFRPSVLVVMPLYNARNFVEKAVTSILSQTYTDRLLLIVNDGSTDGSPELVRQFLGKKVMMVNQPHSGPGAAMNFSIQFARKHQIPYIARMDADDISMPNRLETLLALMRNRDGIAACSSNSHYIHCLTEEIIGTSLVPSSPRLISWEIFHGLRGLIQGACLFQTQALYDVGGYRQAFVQAEDTDLFLRLAERFELANSSDFLYRIRLNPDSLSVKYYRQSVLYQFYTLDCSERRRRGKPELDFDSFQRSLNSLTKVQIWKENKALELWRKYLVRKNYPAFLLASFLSPYRVLARILRTLERNH